MSGNIFIPSTKSASQNHINLHNKTDSAVSNNLYLNKIL